MSVRMTSLRFWTWVFVLSSVFGMAACASSDAPPVDGDEADGDGVTDGDETSDGDVPDGDAEDGDSDDTEDPDGDAEVDGDGGGDEDGDVPPDPIMPRAACGMDTYDVLPRQDVGRLLDYEENIFFDLRPAALDSLLKAAGYTALSPVPYGSRVFRFRYTTQDRGLPVEATAYLSIPANAELPDEPMPLALFGHGTTGFSDPCAPSSSDFDGAAIPGLLASQGFVTVQPDYIGMTGFGEPSETTHGYLVGEQVAIGSWDALRAGLELISLHLSDEITVDPSQTVVWGGSQGGHMALFTELYGPYYAPEFDVKAVVALVPPSTLKPIAEIALSVKSPPTVSMIPILVTMRRWYGEPETLDGLFTNVDPYFLQDTIESRVFVTETCSAGSDLDWEDFEISDVFDATLIERMSNGRWDELPPWSCYFDENSLATSSVPPLRYTPTLMVYSELDDLVVTAPMRDDFDRLCGLGYSLDYLECAQAGHSEGAVWSFPEQFRWVRARLAGEPLDEATHCQRQNPVCCTGMPEDECQ